MTLRRGGWLIGLALISAFFLFIPVKAEDEVEVEKNTPTIEVFPEVVRAGEGFVLRVHEPLAGLVSVSFPDPNGDPGRWMSVDLIFDSQYGWMLPAAYLYPDGRVEYSFDYIEGTILGDRKIYTPFFWHEDTFPVVIHIDDEELTLDIPVEGHLLEQLVYRPVDVRHPFPFGISSLWKDHLSLFRGEGLK